jgi:hypothetical protein
MVNCLILWITEVNIHDLKVHFNISSFEKKINMYIHVYIYIQFKLYLKIIQN